ncbi:hypothetical protein Mapa_007337 [Marchantia paleacea]|nr:hypothetical protein Mapa_007337 [Marchantia paleacea]
MPEGFEEMPQRRSLLLREVPVVYDEQLDHLISSCHDGSRVIVEHYSRLRNEPQSSDAFDTLGLGDRSWGQELGRMRSVISIGFRCCWQRSHNHQCCVAQNHHNVLRHSSLPNCTSSECTNSIQGQRYGAVNCVEQ